MITSIRVAFSFLTRLPLGRAQDTATDVSAAMMWFPLVGLVVGAIVGSIHLALLQLTSPLVAASVALAIGILVTGGFHEDGLGDMADAFGGGWDREQRLAIMKDSRHGTFGVLAIGCSLLIRVAALTSLTGTGAILAVAGAHLLARTWAVVALDLARPATGDGLAGSITGGRHHRTRLAISVAAWLILALIMLGPGRWILMGGLSAAAALATVGLAYRKIGGITGDVAGATQQMGEMVAMTAATLSRPS
ncbi:MAG: adenosylcobinamide-GDP ribazoletransferase [Actinomycetia bacterium]|nr:adenosylcobinamide-GDP ribazoletransferase [Actinomycetes bacterium]